MQSETLRPDFFYRTHTSVNRQRVRTAPQVDRMVREEGLMDPPIRYIPTVVSPVPEEEEEEDEEEPEGMVARWL